MDAGGAVGMPLLMDRLMATLAGSAMVVAANLLMDLGLRLASRTAK